MEVVVYSHSRPDDDGRVKSPPLRADAKILDHAYKSPCT
jgi:hypothetical protein